MPDTQAILTDLARVKALFQLRTIALVIGAPLSQTPATEPYPQGGHTPADALPQGAGHPFGMSDVGRFHAHSLTQIKA